MRAGRSGCASISTGCVRSLAASAWPPPLTHAEWARCARTARAQRRRRSEYLYLQVTRGAEFGRNHAWPEGSPDAVRLPSRRSSRSGGMLRGASPRSPPRTPAGRGATSSPPRCSRMSCSRNSRSDAGAFETILLERGELTEGSSTTVHVVSGGGSTPRRTAITFCRARPATWSPSSRRGSASRASVGAVTEQRAARRRGDLAELFHARRACRSPARRRRSATANRAAVRRMHAAFMDYRASSRERRGCEHAAKLEFPSEFPIKVMGGTTAICAR
jgi:hypothetical protein